MMKEELLWSLLENVDENKLEINQRETQTNQMEQFDSLKNTKSF